MREGGFGWGRCRRQGTGGSLAFYFGSSGRDLVEGQADRPDLIIAPVPGAGEKHSLQVGSPARF